MRRLSTREQIRGPRLARRRAARRLRERRLSKELRRLGISYQRARDGHEPTGAGGSRTLKAPSHLTLGDEGYSDVIDWLNALRKSALDDRLRVVLDLRECELFSPELAPLLAAEVQRVRHFCGGRAVSGISPKDPMVRRVIHALGFFDALGMKDPLSEQAGDNTSILCKIRSETTLDGKITRDIAEDFGRSLSLTDAQIDSIQTALNEALENISEHAYYDESNLKFPAEAGRWWISSICTEGRASLLACDLGLTIPMTVPAIAQKKGAANFEALSQILSGSREAGDVALLQAAFRNEVTRRPDQKGGNGLGKMADLIRDFPAGQLTVWSGGASAVITREKPEVRTMALPKRFDGTYVLWSLNKEPEQ